MVLTYDELIIKELENEPDQRKDLEASRALIVDSELKGGRLHFTGIGKPSYIARYAASLFSSTGTPSYFLDGTEAVHGSSGQVKLNDVVIAISNSGETQELLYSIKTLKSNGAKIIGVSKNKQTSLSLLSDISLCINVENEGDYLNKPPRISIIMQTILIQKLSLLLQDEKNLNISQYGKWHPGGAIGTSIK